MTGNKLLAGDVPPRQRLSIQKEMSLDTTCVLMSEGNLTVLKLLRQCAARDPMVLLHLDDMNCRGGQIFSAFIGFCNGWFPQFIVAATTRDPNMIAYVNKTCPPLVMVKAGGAPRGA